ncbi:hypothetical protein [Bacillus paramobilis]|uniref:hypothetical protein n=1 Tax=Bacillus paramobilis TaxID=2817477 RepID=UPI001BB43F08|nr:hypothetical protein [Bacillus paramobilis]HEF5065785.1 hypothetical protein [Bacillus cereus]HEF5237769.1 hypothetical protein [Bacillus cereus]
MRIIFQGSATPNQIGKAVQTIVQETLEKAEVKGKRQVLHNVVLEANLNIQGHDEPQLLVNDESGTMLTIKTGIENGELTEYVEVDRQELVDKFNRMVADETAEVSSDKNIHEELQPLEESK